MTDKTQRQGVEAVNALRETIEQHGEKSHEAMQLAEKANAAMEAMDDKTDEAMAQVAAEKKARLELEENVKDLELAVTRASAGEGKSDYKNKPEYKALQRFAQVGSEGLNSEEKQLLRQDDSTSGGYTTNTEMDNTIIRQITEISPVRQVARVKTVGKKTLEVPTRTQIPTASYEGEAELAEVSTSKYGNETLTTFRQSVTVPFTRDLMMDSVFDLEAEISQDVSESYAQDEGRNFVLGDGAKKPSGFLNDSRIGISTTSTSQTINGDDLIRLTGDLKVGYMPMYAFNRRTLAFLRTLKGSDGHYLWQAGLGGGAPNTIAGEPYMRFEDMPDIAANSKSVIYADFMRGYCITDRTGMTMIRDIYTQAGANIVRLHFHRYNTGQVVLPEAFRVLQTQA